MKSELGLGVLDGNLDNKRRKKKLHSRNHSKSTDLDKIVNFASVDRRNLSSRHKELEMKIMEEVKEEVKERKLNAENYISVMELDFEKEHESEEEEEEFFNRVHHSCSHSPTEKYITRRINSEIHHLAMVHKHRYPRTSSFDFNTENAAILSPQYLVKKNTWTPNYQKGWSSERVPLQAHLNKGKQLPSKWEDAERWIGSPISVDNKGRSALPSYYKRGSKSKSGPLGSRDSLVPCFDSGKVVNMKAGSPFLAGVLMGDPHCYGSARGVDGLYVAQRSVDVSGWSDLSSQSTSQGQRIDSKEGSMMNSPKGTLKDIVPKTSSTETSECSTKKSSKSTVPVSTELAVDMEVRLSKVEIREIEVDGQSTTIRQEEHGTSGRCLRKIIEWKNETEENSSGFKVIDTSEYLSKDNRDEAKIGAWKNLQKAKAEEAIRKLELKLEKERSASVDKILNKLRSAEKKAEEMRSVVRSNQSNQSRSSIRKAAIHHRFGHLSFLKSCFACHTP